MVHNLTLHRWDEVFYFASLDGESWLEINRPLRPGDEAEFRKRLEGDDGNFRPLTFARRFFQLQPPDAKVEWQEPLGA